MAEFKALPTPVLLHIAKLLNVPLKGLSAVIELLDEGGTVPFIARYRKEATGNLDEVQIRDIEEKLAYFRELEDRREDHPRLHRGAGQTHRPNCKARIEADARKERTRRPLPALQAQAAHQGHRSPARRVSNRWPLTCGTRSPPTSAREHSPRLSSMRKKASPPPTKRSKARATSSPRWISENADFRKALRQHDVRRRRGRQPQAIEGAPDDEQDKFKMYYDYREPVEKIPSHRMLAIRRGENGGRPLLRDRTRSAARRSHLIRAQDPQPPGDWTPHLELAIEDS